MVKLIFLILSYVQRLLVGKPKLINMCRFVNSSTTRGQLIADVLIPTNEKIKAVFESTRGKQSIKGSLKFKKAVNIEPEYQGYNLYIVLDKVATANGFVSYFPIAVTALPYNPEISYYLIDPKFKRPLY